MLLISVLEPLSAQSKDPLIGTWTLDLGKSSFVPDNPPLKRTIVFTEKDGGIRCVIRTTARGGLENGMVSESAYTAKYDAKDYDISESVLDTVSLKKIDTNTIERTGKTGGMVAETATMKISQDGKVLTITTKGSVGRLDYSSLQVYQKQ
jgi:hypothetical protein